MPTPLEYLIVAALLVWIVYRQFVGRFVPARRTLVLPVVLLAVGLEQAVTAHVAFPPLAVAVLVGDLVLTAALGALRAASIRLTVRDGRLFQRGGWPTLGLWLLSIAARVLVALPFEHTAVGAVLTATLTLSFGISIAVQYLVFTARVRADGRPVRPEVDRRQAPAGPTLDR